MLERDPATGLVYLKTFAPEPEPATSQSDTDAQPQPTQGLRTREMLRSRDATDRTEAFIIPQTPPFLRVSPSDPILLPCQHDVQTDRDASCSNAWDQSGIPGLPRSVVLDPEAVVNKESPLMNQLFQLCRHARICCCESPSCLEKKRKVEQLAPPCDWVPFRDWAVQLICCQLNMVDQPNLTSPLLRMSDVVISCHYFLAQEGRAVNKVPSTKLAGRGKTKVTVDAFGAFETIYWMLTIQQSLGLLEIVEQGWDPNFLPVAITEPEVTKASQKATQAGICPNRFWNLTFAMERQHLDLPAIAHAAARNPGLEHREHQACTPMTCTFTVLDSTRVGQLHKCSEPKEKPCDEKVFFDPKRLNESIRNKGRTVWSTSTGEVSQDGPYIAISHVWSDGTGVGVQKPGLVNKCLFGYLSRIIERLGCGAIWWDAISIPEDKVLRREAINNMHRNYSEAKYTVLHDNYLLSVEWADDSEGPCLALILSPWFTRGWTALELIMSGTVKVLYKNPEAGGEPLIKDLDEDILAKDPARCTRAHWIASTIIRRLRQEIHNVSNLVAVLKPRSTSWARDQMVIAGLLAGVEVGYEMPTHQITKAIVDRVWKLNPASLHHGQPTITASGGWSWCPHSLYDMPSETAGDLWREHTVGDRTCLVDRDGVLGGAWYWRPLEQADTRHDFLVPNTQHQSVSFGIRDAIRDWEHCMLLRDANMDGGLGLIVKPADRDGEFVLAHFVGSVRVRESPDKLQGTLADSRYDWGPFRLGVCVDRWKKAVKFYPKHHPHAPFPKPGSALSSAGRGWDWIGGSLWMGDHRREGQLLIARHVDEEGIIEGLRLVISGHHEKRTYTLSPVEDPVFRVWAKSGNGVEAVEAGLDSSNVRLRSVKYEEQWPPEPVPAFGRVYHSDAVPSFDSFSIFKLKQGRTKSNLYALVIPNYLVPGPRQPYGGIWIYIRPGRRLLATLFHQLHSNHLQAIALTGDSSLRRGSLIFAAEDLTVSEEVYNGEGEWNGTPFVEIPNGQRTHALLLVGEDEVVYVQDNSDNPGKNWGRFCRLKAKDQSDPIVRRLLEPEPDSEVVETPA